MASSRRAVTPIILIAALIFGAGAGRGFLFRGQLTAPGSVCFALQFSNVLRTTTNNLVLPVAVKVMAGATQLYNQAVTSDATGRVTVQLPASAATSHVVTLTPKGHLPVSFTVNGDLSGVCIAVPASARAGDVNEDGAIATADLVSLIQAMRGVPSTGVSQAYGVPTIRLTQVVEAIRHMRMAPLGPLTVARGAASSVSSASSSSSSVAVAYNPPTASITVDELNYYKVTTDYFPDIGVNLVRGYAPHAVFFEGYQSEPRENLVSWQWDFGNGTESDPHGRTFEGFNAAHVFETPGTYNVTLRVKDAQGRVSSPASIAIQVLPRTSEVYYVDSEIGDDSYDGRSQTVNGTSGPWKTADRAFQAMKKGNRALIANWPVKPGGSILFRRGQTFRWTLASQYGHGSIVQGVMVGAYGTGAKPKIKWEGTTGTVWGGPNIGGSTLAFVDLDIDLWNEVHQLTSFIGAPASWKQILLLRTDFHDPENGVLSMNGNPVSSKPTAIFMVDCNVDQYRTHANATTQMAGGYSRLALMGNTFDKSGNHIAYFNSVDKAVIWKNVFSRPAFGRTALRFTGGSRGNLTNNLLITENKFLGWIDNIDDSTAGPNGVAVHNGQGIKYNYQLLNFSPVKDEEYLIDHLLFERNVVTNFLGGITVVNVHNAIFRNNIFATPSRSDALIFLSLSSNDATTGATRPLKNVQIVHNTFIQSRQPVSSANTGAFVRLSPWRLGATEWGSHHENIQVKNNVFKSVEPVKMKTIVNAARTAGGTDDDVSAGDFTLNHNLYSFASSTPMWIQSLRLSFAAWLAYAGQDLQSIVAEPVFTGGMPVLVHQPGEPATLEANIAEAERYIQALPIASGPGSNAGTPTDTPWDFNGHPRSATAPDVGAFE